MVAFDFDVQAGLTHPVARPWLDRTPLQKSEQGVANLQTCIEKLLHH